MKIILYPSLSAVLFILGLLSLIWTIGSLSESAAKRSEYVALLAVESSATERTKLEGFIQSEGRQIARNTIILLTVLSASAGAITFMLHDAIEIYNDPHYIVKRKTEKAEKYSKKLTSLHPDTYPAPPPPPAPPPVFVPPPNPLDRPLERPVAPSAATSVAAPTAPKPSGRPIIRSSAAATAAKTAPLPPPAKPVAAPVAAPVPSAPPLPEEPAEFAHEFPELEPEDTATDFDGIY